MLMHASVLVFQLLFFLLFFLLFHLPNESIIFSRVLVLARLDGTLDFLTLLDPAITTRHNITPFKRSSPKVQCKNPRNNSAASDTSPVQAHAVPIRCSLTHRVRAHHQPASVMVVTKDNVITGSHDRTLKVLLSSFGHAIFVVDVIVIVVDVVVFNFYIHMVV